MSGSPGPAGAERPARTPLPRGFVSLWLTVVLDLLGFGIILPILPLYVSDLGAKPFMVGVVLSAYSAAQLVGSPILGRLSDRHGRRPVLVIALVGSAVGHVLTGLAGAVPLIIVARALDGFSGGSLSIAHAAAADLAPPPERPRLFGLLGAGIALGFVAGPALGSLAARGGVRLPFFVAAALCAANAATAWWRLSALPRPAHPAPTPVPAGTVGPAGVGGSADRPEMAGRSGMGGAFALIGWSTLLGRTLLTALVLGIGFAGFESTFGLLGKERVGLTVGSAGLVFAGVGAVLSVVQGFLVKRVIGALGAVRTARLAVTINLVGFALLIPATGWWGLVPALGLLTVGQGLWNPAMSTVLSAVAPEDRRGAVFGAQQAVGAASRIVGPLVALGLFGIATPVPYAVGVVLAVVGLQVLTAVPSDPVPSGTGSPGSPPPASSAGH